MRRCSLILVSALVLAQPAQAALFGNTEELTRQTQALQQRVDALDARLGKLEAALQKNQQMLDLLKEVEQIKAEVARLRGQTEVQLHQLDTLGKRQSDLYADLDQRIAELAKAAQPAPAAAPGPQAAPAVAPQADAQAETQSYEAALAKFRSGNHAGAIAGFKDFLKTYPQSELAANAQYWIGYSYYSLKDYSTALAQQQKLVEAYPASPKVPDALLNVAVCQIALNKPDAARKTLKGIVSKYPGTQAATLASRRLSTLK